MIRPINKILIANRGEIACRIMETCRKKGISSVAVYSDADQDCLHVQKADQAVRLGGLTPAESYLDIEKIIAAARQTNADAIHPGYGFLAENAGFSKRCADEGIIFIGPDEKVINALGLKIEAKESVARFGVPVIPGITITDQSYASIGETAGQIGFPVLIKASAGGGGKGMRIVHNPAELEDAIEAARREALSAFGNDSLLLEKYFESARHIEFQIFGDHHGNAVHLFERECSIQRRYQKIIEESPSPALTPELREKMGRAAVAAAKSVGYQNAGTVEFILVPDGNFYFLEVNTRLQVEHPVTELITGLDLVDWQIEVASGKPLPLKQEEIQSDGHAIEVRLYAEDPEKNFLPATGEIVFWSTPRGEDIRLDTGFRSGDSITPFYDPMIAKLLVKGRNREESLRKMRKVLAQTSLMGLVTNKAYLSAIFEHPDFNSGDFDTGFLASKADSIAIHRPDTKQEAVLMVAAVLWRLNQRRQNQKPLINLPGGWRNVFYQKQFEDIEINDRTIRVRYSQCRDTFGFEVEEENYVVSNFLCDGNSVHFEMNGLINNAVVAARGSEVWVQEPYAGFLKLNFAERLPEPEALEIPGNYRAPLSGQVVKVLVQAGNRVERGNKLVIISSMKMETVIEANENGLVEEVYVQENTFVEADANLIKLEIEK